MIIANYRLEEAKVNAIERKQTGALPLALSFWFQ